MVEGRGPVLIIGAGAAGLLIAQGLRKEGIPCLVFEKFDERKYLERSGRWSMALHWAMKSVQACLPPELYARMDEANTNPHEAVPKDQAGFLPMYNGKTGELLAKIPAESPRRVLRSRLRSLFQEGIDVQFGKELAGLEIEEAGVTAIFNGSEPVQGFAVVGCDGASSSTRSFLVEAEANKLTPASFWSLTAFVSYPAEKARYLRDKMHPVAMLSPHPEQNTYFFMTIADIPDPNEPETWVFHIALSVYAEDVDPSAKTQKERMRSYREHGMRYCEPFRSAIEWTPENHEILSDKYTDWTKISPWESNDGRTTLAGDSAHAMVPYRAQGLNNALEDSGLYVQKMQSVYADGEDLPHAMKTYDEDVYERGKRAIDGSRDQSYACHHWEVLEQSLLLRNGFSKE